MRVTFIIISLFAFTQLTGCKKYPEDESVSLSRPIKRLEGSWTLNNLLKLADPVVFDSLYSWQTYGEDQPSAWFDSTEVYEYTIDGFKLYFSKDQTFEMELKMKGSLLQGMPYSLAEERVFESKGRWKFNDDKSLIILEFGEWSKNGNYAKQSPFNSSPTDELEILQLSKSVFVARVFHKGKAVDLEFDAPPMPWE